MISPSRALTTEEVRARGLNLFLNVTPLDVAVSGTTPSTREPLGAGDPNLTVSLQAWPLWAVLLALLFPSGPWRGC